MLSAYTAASIYDAEAPALAAGEPLMARAARALADAVARRTPPSGRITVFAGKGNNGADGLYAAAHLAREGHSVTAVTAFDVATDLGATSAALTAATDAGAEVVDGEDDDAVRLAAEGQVWVDALTGIGMRPPARGQVADLLALLKRIRAAAPAAKRPIVIAVDIPSGLGADSGAIIGPVLPAEHTVTFGGYKAAQFLPPAAALCGAVQVVDIGIAAEFTRQPIAVHRVAEEDLRRAWARPGPADHKYTRGVVGVVTGSSDYPGAAVLSVHGALGCGPGMVRYTGEVAEDVVRAHPEVITQPGRVQAWVVGSGITGKASAAAAEVETAIGEAMRAAVPIVVDAGALEWVERGAIAGFRATPRVVLTPHAGELAGLLGRCGVDADRATIEADPAPWAAKAEEITGASVVLKGGTTLIASEGMLLSQADGTPWMATAGSGDVLAGILGAVLAGWQVQQEAGGQPTWPGFPQAIAAGVMLHGLAGVHASRGGPTSASEIAGAISPALRSMLAGRP